MSRSTTSPEHCHMWNECYSINSINLHLCKVLLKAQVTLCLAKSFTSDDEVSVYIMYSYMYWLLQ